MSDQKQTKPLDHTALTEAVYGAHESILAHHSDVIAVVSFTVTRSGLVFPTSSSTERGNRALGVRPHIWNVLQTIATRFFIGAIRGVVPGRWQCGCDSCMAERAKTPTVMGAPKAEA